MAAMNMGGLASPMTLASGDKATSILRQMKTGTTIMYRGVGLGMVEADPVVFPLAGFNAAAAECGL
jgi:hypothetical protein